MSRDYSTPFQTMILIGGWGWGWGWGWRAKGPSTKGVSSRTWDEHGQLRSQFTCRFGGAYGNRKEWHANGQLAEDSNYEWGVRLDEKDYDEQGVLTDEFIMDPADPNSQYTILLKFKDAYDKHL